MTGPVAWAGASGRYVIRRIDYLINLVTFILLALFDWFRSIRFFNRHSYRPLVTQIIFTGIDAMPTILFLGLVTGFVFTFRLITLFESVSETIDLITYITCMEIGPIMTAITLISRTGTAITVDLGNMKLHHEIESMELMGVDINQFLVAPRILGVTISQLAAAVFFSMITLSSGIILGGLLISPAYFQFLFQVGNSIDALMLVMFIIKNILFGMIIGATACFHGLKVEKSATEVPQQTQRAVVNMLIRLFIIDGLIAALTL